MNYSKEKNECNRFQNSYALQKKIDNLQNYEREGQLKSKYSFEKYEGMILNVKAIFLKDLPSSHPIFADESPDHLNGL